MKRPTEGAHATPNFVSAALPALKQERGRWAPLLHEGDVLLGVLLAQRLAGHDLRGLATVQLQGADGADDDRAVLAVAASRSAMPGREARVVWAEVRTLSRNP